MMTHNQDFSLNEELAYLIEALKVESYWSRKNFTLTIQNKNLGLLRKIEDIVKNLGIRISKRTLIKIRLPDKTKKEEVEMIWNNKKINFHIGKSPFDQNKVKAVSNLPYKKSYKILLKYNKETIPANFKYKNNEIKCDSKLDCWAYGDLRFPTKRILDFLENYTGGKKNLTVEDKLFNSKEKVIMSAFSALIDCEGSINWYGFKREIQIRMKEKLYLEKWCTLLNKKGIGCRTSKHGDLWEIIISGWEDFDRLNKMGIKFYHSEKIDKWKRMMKGFKRNQISRNSYKQFYTRKLKELNKKVTAQEFADHIKKSKRVANHYLLKLEKENLILCDRKIWPYQYSILTSSVR